MKYISLSIFLALSTFGQKDGNAISLTDRLRHRQQQNKFMEDASLLYDEEETKESPAPKKEEDSEQADPEATDDDLAKYIDSKKDAIKSKAEKNQLKLAEQ